jgi:hypothetical protein
MILYRSNTILISFLILSQFVGWIIYNLFQNTDNLSLHTGILVLGIIIFLLSIVIFIRSLYQLFFKKPILVINSEGFYTPKTGSISWNDIEKIGTMSSSVIPDSWDRYMYITSVPFIWIYLKIGKKFQLNRAFYSVDPIEVLKVLQQYRPVISMKNGANFFTSQ